MSEEIKGFQYIYDDDDDEFDYPATVVLDFLNCKDFDDLDQEMRTKMKWRYWYGDGWNLDALWDILTGMPYYGTDFTILRRREYKNIPHNAKKQFEERIDQIYGIFLKAMMKRMPGGVTSVKMLYDDELTGTNESFAV